MKAGATVKGLELDLIDDYPTTAQIIKAHKRAQHKQRKLSFRKGFRLTNGSKRDNGTRIQPRQARP